MKKTNIMVVMTAVALAAVVVSCKPSEKNYREAYEIAQARRHEDIDDELFAKLKTEDTPRLVMYGADSVYVSPKESLLTLWRPDSDNKTVTPAPPYNLVVGEYQNRTNAKAHAMRFMPAFPSKDNNGKASANSPAVPEGWDWHPMVLTRGADNRFYVAIAHGDSIEELLPAMRLFKEKKLRTVGIPCPVVKSRR